MGVDIYADHPVEWEKAELYKKLERELGFTGLRGFRSVGRKLFHKDGVVTDIETGETVDVGWVDVLESTTGCDFQELRIVRGIEPDMLWRWLVHALRKQRDVGLTPPEAKVLRFLEIIADHEGELSIA